MPEAERVIVTDDTLTAELSDGRTIAVPLGRYPRLTHATPRERDNWELIGAGDTWDEMQAVIHEALVFHIENLLERGEPLPEPKMSIDEAIAHHKEPIPEDVLRSYAEYGDDTPTLSTRFGLVEVEVPAPQAAQAG